MMPPPNVTGKLHMGHALDGTIQDILIRFKRMQGYDTLWLPGSDHAAIATEVKVVEKMNKEEGLTKADITREEFLTRAWAWTKEYGGTIQDQQRRLGCSCDWSRNRFTMDEGLSEAVTEQFIRLYEKGLIYKGKKMINWCPSCHTTISDAEVEHEEEASHLWHIKYPIVGEKDRYVMVATTRPETMLGDTAVAVHPNDKRYQDLIGKKCILPIMNKEIPIIADEFVDQEFGTGCVKLTPSHDPNDYQAALRHNLPIVEVFDDSSIMGNLVPEYQGMKAIDARKTIVEKLKEEGYLLKIEDYPHNVGKCYRCHNTIEPRISEQWFVSMKDLGKTAADAVRNDEVKFVPKRYEKMYFNWLDNIQDWCISRQLWWGHRIPAYYCDKCGHIQIARTMPEVCEKCGDTHFHQDEDSLDTWFSSALWPFSTLGWPNENEQDYQKFYPTNVLVTAYDIITFWVSRMMTQGIELTGKNPFSDVLIHGIIRDSQGRKMSKSLGNGIDPIEVIEQYGADALRFSVLSGTTMGNDIRYMPEKLEQAASFANKIWNAAKFITMNQVEADEIVAFGKENKDQKTGEYREGSLKIEDKWIIHRLQKLITEVTINIENYDLGVALDKIYNFIWNEFCDWYIEMVKPRLYSENQEEKVRVGYVLNEIFLSSMKLLHPFMPFITTKISKSLIHMQPQDAELIISQWPEAPKTAKYEKEAKTIEKLQQIIVEIRNIRANRNIHPSKKAELIFVTENEEQSIWEAKDFLLKLGFGEKLIIQKDKTGIKENAIGILGEDIEVYLPLEELVDLAEERKRLEEEKQKLTQEVARCEKMLANPGFVSKAPESKIKEEKEKLTRYQEMLRKVNENLGIQ
jgi:valyl-tRNA synthetase